MDRVYVGECVGIRSVGGPRKSWIDAVRNCLRKRGLDVGQARRVCEGECVGRGPGDEPQILARCLSCGLCRHVKPVGGNLSVTEPTT